MSDTYETPPPAFLNSCSLEFHFDESGNEIGLTLTCHVRNRQTGEVLDFSKDVDLVPMVKLLVSQFAKQDQVSGMGDILKKATNAAKKIATSKAASDLFAKVKPGLKFVPYVGQAIAVYDVVKEARKGKPDAIAKLKNAALKAADGDPKAIEVITQAKALKDAQDLKDAQNAPLLANRIASLEAKLNPLIRSGAIDLDDPSPEVMAMGDEIAGLMSRLKSAAKFAVDPRKHLKLLVKASDPRNVARAVIKASNPLNHLRVAKKLAGLGSKGRRGAGPGESPAVTTPSDDPADMDFNDEEYLDEGYETEDGGEQLAEDVTAGWRQYLYSRPFRTPAQAMLDGSPGIGMALRSLYSDGLANIIASAK